MWVAKLFSFLVGDVLDYYDTFHSLINNNVGLYHSTWYSRDDA